MECKKTDKMQDRKRVHALRWILSLAILAGAIFDGHCHEHPSTTPGSMLPTDVPQAELRRSLRECQEDIINRLKGSQVSEEELGMWKRIFFKGISNETDENGADDEEEAGKFLEDFLRMCHWVLRNTPKRARGGSHALRRSLLRFGKRTTTPAVPTEEDYDYDSQTITTPKYPMSHSEHPKVHKRSTVENEDSDETHDEESEFYDTEKEKRAPSPLLRFGRRSDEFFDTDRSNYRDVAEFLSKKSLLRFGKRGQQPLLRFGRRSGLLRFGKRSSLLRFGRGDEARSWSGEDGTPRAGLLRFGRGDEARSWSGEDGTPRAGLLRFGRGGGSNGLLRFGRR
ncbi:unnamed protein product [Cyprideis torosa]|uniref:Uncharacterized protein n=1 Tax=Cyprideis torosa TaxID=163714 RepID=A0A7R8WBB8_9CRUS|nr:unnamed protein product [Cyprideis torosa]CAG0886755.1 unnamed protein product [Cyprideis torosa]